MVQYPYMENITSHYNLLIFDTETTGNQTNDRICQLAYKVFGEPTEKTFDELYKPEVIISVESQAVHHITPKMVVDKPNFKESKDFTQVKELFENPQTILVAHNAKFDVTMLQKEDVKIANAIDTLKIVRYLDPEMKIARHNLQYLRYLLELDNDIHEKIQAHDAKGDVLILEKLFIRLFIKVRAECTDDTEALEKMIEISKKPTLIVKFTFGKHNGSTVEDVVKSDKSYLQWLLKTKRESEQDDEDWIYTLEHFLNI